MNPRREFISEANVKKYGYLYNRNDICGEMRRHIKIAFTDFWDGFKEDDNLFTRLLSEVYDVEISDHPDYLFYSVFGNDHLKFDNCIRVFYTGENQVPDFNICDYALGFDHMDFGDRYLRMPIYVLYADKMEKMERRHLLSDDEIDAGRDRFCSFVYSNNNASRERNIFFDRLSEYRKVSSGGRFMNNVGGPVADKLEFQKKHKFSIAFENTSHPGYVTEKIIDSFAAGTIPIYWGDPRISETFNTGAFVNCHDYDSLDEVVEAVKMIDRDDALYRKMLHTPALQDGADTLSSLCSRLQSFLQHIVDQPLDEARRYSRDYWAVRYLGQLRSRESAFGWTPRGLADRIYKATLWKWRRSSRLLWKIDRLIK